MKKVLFLTALAVGAANADIVPNLAAGNGGVTCAFDVGFGTNVCTFNYTATIHSETKLTAADDDPEFFTIYDFNGYIDGSGVAPAGWEFSTSGLGLTPSRINIGAD